VDPLAKYEIPFSGLALGKHQFELEIDDTFFNQFEHAIIEHGRIKVAVTLDKQTLLLQFDFVITGSMQLECDRCAGDFDFPVHLNEHLIVKFGDYVNEEDIDILVIPHTADKVNLAQQLYEYISLARPLHCEHPLNEKGKSTCDPKMLKLLSKLEADSKPHEEPDHRWDALLKLKNEGLN